MAAGVMRVRSGLRRIRVLEVVGRYALCVEGACRVDGDAPAVPVLRVQVPSGA